MLMQPRCIASPTAGSSTSLDSATCAKTVQPPLLQVHSGCAAELEAPCHRGCTGTTRAWKRMWSATMLPSSATVLTAPDLEGSYTKSPSGCSPMPGRRSRWPSSGALP